MKLTPEIPDNYISLNTSLKYKTWKEVYEDYKFILSDTNHSILLDNTSTYGFMSNITEILRRDGLRINKKEVLLNCILEELENTHHSYIEKVYNNISKDINLNLLYNE